MSENLIEKLTAMFLRFPGIGPRQARRFVYFLLQEDATGLERLSRAIKELKKNTAQCPECFRFFVNQLKSDDDNLVCELCLDVSRDKTAIMVIEKDADLETIKKADGYRGRFFVLGGLVPILEAKPAGKIRIRELIKQLEKTRPREIILALSVNPEGDYTVEYLKKTLAPTLAKSGAKITILGRGLSTGTELEYSDTETLAQALKNRR